MDAIKSCGCCGTSDFCIIAIGVITFIVGVTVLGVVDDDVVVVMVVAVVVLVVIVATIAISRMIQILIHG